MVIARVALLPRANLGEASLILAAAGLTGAAVGAPELTKSVYLPEHVGANHLVVAGMGLVLAFVVTGTVLLVVDVVVNRTAALWSSGSALVLLVGLWFVLPRLVARGTAASD